MPISMNYTEKSIKDQKTVRLYYSIMFREFESNSERSGFLVVIFTSQFIERILVAC